MDIHAMLLLDRTPTLQIMIITKNSPLNSFQMPIMCQWVRDPSNMDDDLGGG